MPPTGRTADGPWERGSWRRASQPLLTAEGIEDLTKKLAEHVREDAFHTNLSLGVAFPEAIGQAWLSHHPAGCPRTPVAADHSQPSE